jgi:cytoskeletal protein RodZ
VSIGETLGQARSRAGLTVPDVAARTRIRETLIRAIERDDFAVCGGDFYARGHIRAIAGVVKADAGALISEYDAAHPSAAQPTLEELPRRSSPPRGHRNRLPLFAVAAVLVLAVIGLASYEVAAGTTGTPRLSSSPPRHRVVVTHASSHASTPSTPSPRTSPATTPISDVTPVSATAFGPGGTSDGDNPQQAPLALSGDPATPWYTNWYATALFGNDQNGTGLLVDLGRTVQVTGARIQLGTTPGANFQLQLGTTTSNLKTVTSDNDAGGLVRLRLASPVSARYLLIWFTLLPPDSNGTYQADISGVTATITP